MKGAIVFSVIARSLLNVVVFNNDSNNIKIDIVIQPLSINLLYSCSLSKFFGFALISSNSSQFPLIFSIFRTPDNTDFGSSYHRTRLESFSPVHACRLSLQYYSLDKESDAYSFAGFERTDVIKIQHPSEQSRGNYRLFSCLLETEDVWEEMELKVSGVRYSFLGISDNRIHLSAVH